MTKLSLFYHLYGKPTRSEFLKEKIRYLAELEVSDQADRDAEDLTDEEWSDMEAPPPISVDAVELHKEAQ